MKITWPASTGGMKVAIACPNMWLSGNRFRNLNGENGLAYFLYLRISRSTGTMFASTLRCVMTTPFGSAVAPDVKMISATSSAVTVTDGTVPSCQSISCRNQRGTSIVAVNGGTSCPSNSNLARTMRATRARKSGDAR